MPKKRQKNNSASPSFLEQFVIEKKNQLSISFIPQTVCYCKKSLESFSNCAGKILWKFPQIVQKNVQLWMAQWWWWSPVLIKNHDNNSSKLILLHLEKALTKKSPVQVKTDGWALANGRNMHSNLVSCFHLLMSMPREGRRGFWKLAGFFESSQ